MDKAFIIHQDECISKDVIEANMGPLQPVHNYPKWISVKDNLPPFSETVLVVDKDGDICLADRSRKGYPYNDEEWEWREQVEGWAIYNVTHWLSIPELPR